MRDTLSRIGLVAFAFVASVQLASAGSITSLTLYPGSASNVIGDGSTSAPGFSSGSWQADATSAGAKSELYVPAGDLFSGSVTINDIQSISYWTNKPGSSSDPDWSFTIYTAKTGSGDTGSFYHSRLTSEPYLTNTSSANDPSNTWHKWSTDDPSNPMRFYDSNRDGGVFGTYNDPTLADLQAGTINWPKPGATPYNYGGDTISLFSLQTGSAWANGFTGLVDGVTITLKSGDVGTINLEAAQPVPEPSSLALFGFGAAALAGWRLRRKHIRS